MSTKDTEQATAATTDKVFTSVTDTQGRVHDLIESAPTGSR